jgi:hypothetical protein
MSSSFLSKSLRSRLIQKNSIYNANGRFCIRALCEHENCWHPSGSPIEYEQLLNIPEAHFAYFIRIMSLIKQISNKQMNMEILMNPIKLDELIAHFEKHFSSIEQNNEQVIKYQTVTHTTVSSKNSNYKELKNDVFDFKESYNSIKYFVSEKLDLLGNDCIDSTLNQSGTRKSHLDTGRGKKEAKQLSKNMNRIEYFKLNRCALASGRVLWLCDDHCLQDENIQILTDTQNMSVFNYQNDEFNAILFEEIKKLNEKL